MITPLLLGDFEGAIRGLEKSYAADPRHFTWAELHLNPEFDPLRNDARFQALVVRAEANPQRSPHAKLPQPPPDQKSVAVLAFANLSDDKDNECFSDGISEELLNVLGRVPGLRVAAPMSAFYFKGKNVSAQEIGQKLNVA